MIVKIEPNGRGKGVEIISDVSGSAIPEEYIKPVIEGVRQALDGGMAVGNPAVDDHAIIDIIVRVVDGSFHKTDSSDMAFKLAGIFAIKDAIKKAVPIVIE